MVLQCFVPIASYFSLYFTRFSNILRSQLVDPFGSHKWRACWQARYGCKHKSNSGQPSSEDPHTVSMNSKSFYFTKVLIKAFGAYDICSRKLKKNDTIDCSRLLSTTSSLLNSPY